MSWQRRAACRRPGTDPDLWFPDKGANQSTIRAAKAICATCPVTAECLQGALERDERFGVWGGKSERERRTLRPPRAAVARRVA